MEPLLTALTVTAGISLLLALALVVSNAHWR
jgi:hypothetical protein